MTPFIKVDPKWLKAASARLPSSAKLIDALYRQIQKPDIDIDHVIRLVSMDVAITSRLLRMANSASYTRGETVTSLDQAISWLGVFQAYRVACITVTAKAGLDPKAGYTIGLLHNLGRIVLQRVALQMEIPAGAGDLPDIQAVVNWEREVFGCTHAELGGSVLSLWGLNPIFSKVLVHQHDMGRVENPEVRRWGELLHLKATLVASTEFGLGVTSDAWPISEAMFADAGISQLAILKMSEEITVATKVLCEQSGLVIVSAGSNSL